MDFIEGSAIVTLASPGVASRQLLWPQTSPGARCTITEVHVAPHAVQPRHTHEASEQVWYALSGTGTLLLADGGERVFVAGDVVRFAPGDVHGIVSGEEDFVYLSVTIPPVDFRGAYDMEKKVVGK